MVYNSFNSKRFRSHTIKINVDKRKQWDIPEYNGSMTEIDGYVVCKTNSHYTYPLIRKIHTYIELIKKRMAEILSENPPRDQYYCYAMILAITPCSVQEITPNNKFNGLNKPYDIVKLDVPDGLKFKQDTSLRAGRRHIMLELVHKNGKRKKWGSVKKLLLHEMAHTMCNHVTYREEGNHMDDFDDAEKFLTFIVNRDNFIRQYEESNFIGL